MSWHPVCLVSELPADTGKECLVAGRVLALFRVDDSVYAIDGMCAHQGGPVAQGQLAGTCVTCPWHGWQYDVTCGKNLLTGKVMLESFATQIRGDQVWVDLPDQT